MSLVDFDQEHSYAVGFDLLLRFKDIKKAQPVSAQQSSNIEFKSYDSVNHIVVLEVIDNLFRSEIERNYGDAFARAIKYVYGKDAKFSICCRQFMF